MNVTRAEANKSAWRKFDSDAAIDTQGKVAHAATAKANIQAAGIDIVEALPDKTFVMTAAAVSSGLNPILIVVALLAGLLTDAVELVMTPFVLVKDLFEAIGHGIASLFRKDGKILLEPSEPYGGTMRKLFSGESDESASAAPAKANRAIANVTPSLQAPKQSGVQV